MLKFAPFLLYELFFYYLIITTALLDEKGLTEEQISSYKDFLFPTEYHSFEARNCPSLKSRARYILLDGFYRLRTTGHPVASSDFECSRVDEEFVESNCTCVELDVSDILVTIRRWRIHHEQEACKD